MAEDADVETLTIRIPMQLQRRGGRKLIMTPEGATLPPPKPRRDETLINALVRAHRWRREIESGRAKSITDLAEQEGVTVAFVCRLLPLTCLAPDIVEAILAGRQPKGFRLAEVLGNGPLVWEEQRRAFVGGRSAERPAADPLACGSDVASGRYFARSRVGCALRMVQDRKRIHRQRRGAMTAPITPERLRAHVVCLAGEIGERNVFRPAALDAAAGYISGYWESFGYRVRRQEYEVGGVTSANLEVERSGRDAGRGILLIGAHYDSVQGCPGANDNGSGVAAMLELSRCFADLEPACTVRFVAFVNEEPPFFVTGQQGSMVYARAARQRGDNIRLMVSLETMGYLSDAPRSQRYPPLFRHFYPDRGSFLGLVSDFRSRRRMLRLARAFRAASDFPLEHAATFRWVPGVAWSDHRSFWREGYRALMVTDTAFYRYRHYHTAADTPDKLTYPAFARATEGLYAAFAALAFDCRL